MSASHQERLYAKGREILQQSPQLAVSVDIEANGIAGRGSMVQLGAWIPELEEDTAFSTNIQPAFSEYLIGNRQFTESIGLGNLELEKSGAPTAEKAMANFDEWLKSVQERTGKQALLFVGLGGGFDSSFVDLYYRNFGKERDESGDRSNPFGHRAVDLNTLALPLASRWDFDLTKKANMPDIIKPEGEFTHVAVEDARYQGKLYLGMTALLANQELKGLIRALLKDARTGNV